MSYHGICAACGCIISGPSYLEGQQPGQRFHLACGAAVERGQRFLSSGGPEAAASASVVIVSRRTLDRCRDIVERVLAFSGENPDRELVTLQHELVALLDRPSGPPASLQP